MVEVLPGFTVHFSHIPISKLAGRLIRYSHVLTDRVVLVDM